MKKLNTKTLFIGLVILLVIFAASRYFRSASLENNLTRNFLDLDTASVSEVRVQSPAGTLPLVKLVRHEKTWQVVNDNRHEAANPVAIKNMLSLLANFKVQRFASRKKDKWDEFKIGDNSTRVSVYRGDKLLGDFHIGKLGFTPGAGMMGGAFTYVRKASEDNVYTVEGFLESVFPGSFNDWRDKALLKINPKDISKIVFRYPMDSGFVFEKRDSAWYAGVEKTDPAKAQAVVSAFSSKYLTEFADGFAPPHSPDVTIEVYGGPRTLATLEAWKNGPDWVLSSSFQKGVYFSAKGSASVADIFTRKSRVSER